MPSTLASFVLTLAVVAPLSAMAQPSTNSTGTTTTLTSTATVNGVELRSAKLNNTLTAGANNTVTTGRLSNAQALQAARSAPPMTIGVQLQRHKDNDAVH
jgi:hypothetical protein